MRARILAASALFSLAAAFSAAAQPSEDEAIDDAIACRDISEPLARLACLDKAAETLAVTRIIREEEIAEQKREERENFGLAGAPRNTDDPIETEAEFGSEGVKDLRRDRDEKRLKAIESKIAEIRINKFGKVTLTLENGQVWRQLDSDDKLLHFPKGDRLYTAEVKRSVFGNYRLNVPELKRVIRVSRIK